MQIIELKASNIKRIRAISITPDGAPTVVVGGRHGNGKSSTLDCILYALAGEKALPPVPLREGAMKGEIEIDLGPLKVRRTFTRKGEDDYTTTLEVRDADGNKVSSPQRVLDQICSNLTFDPLEFARLKPKQQLETLKNLVKVDFSKLDAERATIYQERTEVNRTHKSRHAEMLATPEHNDVPAEEVSVAELAKELERRQQHNKANDEFRKELGQVRELYATGESQLTQLANQIEKLRAEYQAKQEKLATLGQQVQDQQAKVDALKDEDVAEVRQQLNTVEGTNRKVRENKKLRELALAVGNLEKKSQEMTARIEAIDAEKERLLKEVKFPVPGLSFGTDGVLLNGLPLEQACTKDQIELSVAMGIALNPTLRVMLIREGSSLFPDETGLGLICEIARKNNAQVWIERASIGSECSVIIHDGQVAESVAS